MGSHQVQTASECNLSEKTGHDVGGLDTATGLRDTVHHFEMKPLLGKLITYIIVLYCILCVQIGLYTIQYNVIVLYTILLQSRNETTSGRCQEQTGYHSENTDACLI